MVFTSEEASLLLRNKFLVVLGDSIQRAVYKDLVLFLQKGNHLTDAQLRRKCETSFEGDRLVDAGQLMNGVDFRESRQFVQPFHLLKFHFLTRVYSEYVESILTEFQNGLSPDILIINSCVWDISRGRPPSCPGRAGLRECPQRVAESLPAQRCTSRKWRRLLGNSRRQLLLLLRRYGADAKLEYYDNLSRLFQRLRVVLQPHCLVIWSTAMPLGTYINGGFLPSKLQTLAASLNTDVITANFDAAWLASTHGYDVLDLHFHFRLQISHQATDGIHWNQLAHRHITQLLLRHIAEAWGVSEPRGRRPVLQEGGSHRARTLGRNRGVRHCIRPGSDNATGTSGQHNAWACPNPRSSVDVLGFDRRWRLVHDRLVLRRCPSYQWNLGPYAHHPHQWGPQRPGSHGSTGY